MLPHLQNAGGVGQNPSGQPRHATDSHTNRSIYTEAQKEWIAWHSENELCADIVPLPGVGSLVDNRVRPLCPAGSLDDGLDLRLGIGIFHVRPPQRYLITARLAQRRKLEDHIGPWRVRRRPPVIVAIGMVPVRTELVGDACPPFSQDLYPASNLPTLWRHGDRRYGNRR